MLHIRKHEIEKSTETNRKEKVILDMLPDFEKMINSETSLQLKGNASVIEPKNKRRPSKSSSEFFFSDNSSVSSFTHESQRNKHFSNNLKEKLLKNIDKKSQDILQGIKNYDKSQTGKILPVNLYNVLRIFCFPLSLKEFENIIKEEPEDENGYISYRSFLSSTVNNGKEHSFSQPRNETWTELNSLNIDDLEIVMKNKIKKNLKNFIRCMWLHDLNNDGLIQKDDFKTVLENVCFPLSDELFSRFWSFYDPCHSGVMNYKDFLLKLGTRVESYKRILPQSKKCLGYAMPHSTRYSRQEQLQLLYAKLGRDDPAIQGQFFNQILAIFKEKVTNELPLLMRILQIKDPKSTGFVHLSVFHQVLNFFVMPMSLPLFKDILRSLNVPTNSTKIAWYSVLKKTSANGNVDIAANQQSLKGTVSWEICKSVLENLKKHGKNADNFFKSAFTLPAPNHQLSVTRSELRRLINQSLVLPLSDEDFKHMMFLLDPNHTNFIDCQKFLSLFKAINEEKESSVIRLPDDPSIETRNPDTSLSGEKLKRTFKKYFNKNLKNIEKAVYAFDREESGALNIQDFKKILDSFCFRLTDTQFFEIVDTFTLSNKVYYGDFIISNRKGPYEDEEKWKTCINKLAVPKFKDKKKIDAKDMMDFIKRTVFANKKSFLEEFLENDLCGVGAIRKEIFLKILQKYVFKLTESQLENLWSDVPKNEIGLLKYEEFLNEWCLNDQSKIFQPKTKSPLSSKSSIISTSSVKARTSLIPKERPKTASSVISNKSAKLPLSLRPKSAASHQSLSNLSIKTDSNTSFTDCGILTKQQYNQYKTLNLEKSESLIRHAFRASSDNMNDKFIDYDSKRRAVNDYEMVTQKRWRDILRRCKQIDLDNQDTIPWNAFIDILQKIGITINEEVEKCLENKYGLRKDAAVNYWVFLNKSLSKMNLQQCIKVDNMADWKANHKITPRHESVGLCKVLLNYRDKILKNYRDLQHAFRRADLQHTREITTAKFKKILMLHKIYIKDQDMFYIQDHFDPTLSEKIPYDTFLKAFVKT